MGSCTNQSESSQQNKFMLVFAENPRKTFQNRVEIEPGTHWWKASAITTTPTLVPNRWNKVYGTLFWGLKTRAKEGRKGKQGKKNIVLNTYSKQTRSFTTTLR